MTACPWDGFEPAVRAFCETNRCAWLVQPANAISSFAYVISGGILLRQKREKPVYFWFGWITIAVGIGSFLCHGTFTLIGELSDLCSMYFFSALLLVLNLRRVGWLKDANWRPFFLVVAAVSTAFFVLFPVLGIWLFGTQIGLFLSTELYCVAKRKSAGTRYADFARALGVFTISFGIWQLDAHKIVCSPDNHWLQGHAAWHVLNSVVMYYVARFYSQFRFQISQIA